MFEKSFNATFVPLIPKKMGATELILLVFEACSVLEVNWRKISLFQLQEVQQIQLLASSLDCRVENLPTVYVGMPLCSKHKALGIWDVIIETTEKKI
uniref:Putative ovule protein n=1 Tax=Solanum chacoense TaxID=4108 RepID=A0A0V0I0Y4_SOLCH